MKPFSHAHVDSKIEIHFVVTESIDLALVQTANGNVQYSTMNLINATLLQDSALVLLNLNLISVSKFSATLSGLKCNI